MIGSQVHVGLSKWSLGCCTLLLAACQSQSADVNVVVFNYWPRALADVYVNGQWAGGGFSAYTETGGTGGSIFCCHKVTPGKVEVKWMLGGGLGDPMTGKVMSATVDLSSIKPQADYLGVYLYPDGNVALDTARGIPDDRLPPANPSNP